MIVVAIDPGVNGAYAFLTDELEEPAFVGDLPVVDGNLDASALARLLGGLKIDTLVVERVNAMPGQGVSSMFKFGRAYGTILGVAAALGIETELVTPVQWKRAYALPGKDKEKARELATRLYPKLDGLSRKKDHGRAEALLLARWWLTRRTRGI